MCVVYPTYVKEITMLKFIIHNLIMTLLTSVRIMSVEVTDSGKAKRHIRTPAMLVTRSESDSQNHSHGDTSAPRLRAQNQ